MVIVKQTNVFLIIIACFIEFSCHLSSYFALNQIS